MIIPIGAGVSQAVSPVHQDFVTLVETLKAWVPMLEAQILQQNYQASVSGSGLTLLSQLSVWLPVTLPEACPSQMYDQLKVSKVCSASSVLVHVLSE